MFNKKHINAEYINFNIMTNIKLKIEKNSKGNDIMTNITSKNIKII